MITFDDWLEMQNNGVLMPIDEFKNAPVYNEQNCYATVLDKDTICICANENSLVLGYKTMYQMIWHYKLYDITLVCKLLIHCLTLSTSIHFVQQAWEILGKKRLIT